MRLLEEEVFGMDDLETLTVTFSETEAAVFELLHSERRKLEAQAAALIQQIEAQRDLAVRKLDRAAAALLGQEKAAAPATRVPAAKRPTRRRAKKKGKTTAEGAEERRLAVQRYLEEQGRPLKPAEIAPALRLPDFSTKSALRRLVKDGIAIRTGTGSGTRYQLASGGTARDERETAQGRIVTTIEDRGLASLEELAQAARISIERAERECASLIVEGVIGMTRRDGRSVYVMEAAA
jgi:hypothetical protein